MEDVFKTNIQISLDHKKFCFLCLLVEGRAILLISDKILFVLFGNINKYNNNLERIL